MHEYSVYFHFKKNISNKILLQIYLNDKKKTISAITGINDMN